MSDRRSSFNSLTIKDVIVILIAVLPVGITWGVHTTKNNLQETAIIELRQENRQLRDEDKSLRQLITDIKSEMNRKHNDVSNDTEILKERVNTLIKSYEKHSEHK